MATVFWILGGIVLVLGLIYTFAEAESASDVDVTLYGGRGWLDAINPVVYFKKIEAHCPDNIKIVVHMLWINIWGFPFFVLFYAGWRAYRSITGKYGTGLDYVKIVIEPIKSQEETLEVAEE